MPPPSPSVLQPQRRPNPENKPATAAAIPHTRRTEVQPKHERPDIRPANVLYSCIDRAKRLTRAPRRFSITSAAPHPRKRDLRCQTIPLLISAKIGRAHV